MFNRAPGVLAFLGALALGACQTTPTAQSGLLTSYEGAAAPGQSLRAVVSQRRDDRASDAIESVIIEPAVMTPDAGQAFSEAERRQLLREVDRQVCFEISERFTLAPAVEPGVAVVRVFVVGLKPTGPIGSAASAAAGFFNPVPIIDVRAPWALGGLAIESELLAPGTGVQVAFVTWGRDATVVGTDSPSLSRLGDALQFAEPMADAVADAFASEARPERKIEDPDPCAQYGPRLNLARTAGGVVVGIVTGLYVPEIEQPGPPK